MASIRNLAPWQKMGLAIAVVAVVALALLANQVWAWQSAERLPGATLLVVSKEEASGVKTTRGRYRLEIEVGGQSMTGYMDTYWGVGAPSPREVADLRVIRRVSDGNVPLFAFDTWHRAFRAWLVLGGLLVMAVGVWIAVRMSKAPMFGRRR